MVNTYCVVMGSYGSSSWFYVDADRFEVGINTYTKKPGDIRFYRGNYVVCFVDSHKVYEISQVLDNDVITVYQEGGH